MLFEIAKNTAFLQDLAVNLLSSIHPLIMHNLAKIEMIKKALWHCELEYIEGSYFEFGVFEGTSLLAAVKIYNKLKSKIKRNFYGFDSFDDGLKYFDERDKHPFFKEGDFKCSYQKVLKRVKKFKNAHLIKGYFEERIAGKNTNEICGNDKCAIVFIDCDFMNPAFIALNFIRPILQVGSIIILDDFFAYKGNLELGTYGALNRFLKENQNIKVREYYKYGHGGASFIVTNI